mgnify:FL=1
MLMLALSECCAMVAAAFDENAIARFGILRTKMLVPDPRGPFVSFPLLVSILHWIVTKELCPCLLEPTPMSENPFVAFSFATPLPLAL